MPSVARERLNIQSGDRLLVDVQDGLLILLPQRNKEVEDSARNLPDVTTLRASYLNVRDLLVHDHVVIPLESLSVVESILG